uniref:Pdi3 n=1 Tax=Arundo donax TaxID=35708 RepID=A0A0A9E0V3_ARUDO
MSLRNFCPSLRKQQSHSRESFYLSLWSETMRKLANQLPTTLVLLDKIPQSLLTRGMKMLGNFSLMLRCHWTPLRNLLKVS